MSKVLLVIDIQNDYFAEGAFPLWNVDAALEASLSAITKAQAQHLPIVLVQHIANPAKGIAPFFNADTTGVAIHPRILDAAPQAPIVIKSFADSFEQTRLTALLTELNATELVICGMMTQNCVTHTAISKAAEAYQVSILSDCCTTVSQMIHLIALNAVATRVPLVTLEQAFT